MEETKKDEIKKGIRQILLHEWDPIGIKDESDAQDEYDSYVDSIYKLLVTKPSIEQIAKYIVKIEIKQMGLGKRNLKDVLLVAKRLLFLI